jgi:hypothetical protein
VLAAISLVLWSRWFDWREGKLANLLLPEATFAATTLWGLVPECPVLAKVAVRFSNGGAKGDFAVSTAITLLLLRSVRLKLIMLEVFQHHSLSIGGGYET